MLIRTTYEIVTPESAEDGDVADRGWEDEEGTEYDIEEAIRLLEGCEPSCSQFSGSDAHAHVWYIGEHDVDYGTGDETTLAYHLSECTEAEQREVWEGVTKRRIRR